jgi:hypothetical protein
MVQFGSESGSVNGAGHPQDEENWLLFYSLAKAEVDWRLSLITLWSTVQVRAGPPIKELAAMRAFFTFAHQLVKHGLVLSYKVIP